MKTYEVPLLEDVKTSIKEKDRSKGLMIYLYFRELITDSPHTAILIVKKITETLKEGLSPADLSVIKPTNIRTWRSKYKNIVIRNEDHGTADKPKESAKIQPLPEQKKQEDSPKPPTQPVPLEEKKGEDKPEPYKPKKWTITTDEDIDRALAERKARGEVFKNNPY